MASFRFHTRWVLAGASPDAVFDALHDYQRWSEWWPGVEEAVELEPAGPDGLGGVGRYVWRSRAGYRLRFLGTATVVDRPRVLEGTVDGDLSGVGRWRVTPLAADEVEATYDWHVRTTRRWMNLLAPLLRPLFDANHDRIMRDGGLGLARLLDARLVANE